MSRRMFLAGSGVLLCGISVGMLQVASFGFDPFTCFVTAIDHVGHLSFAVGYPIITAVMLIFFWIVNRHLLGIATILNLFLIGTCAQVTKALSLSLGLDSFTSRALFMVSGLVLMCLASALYYTADLGVSGYDAVALTLAQRFRQIPFRWWRISCDLICVLVGFAGQASVGIGTVITALFMGPLITFFQKTVSEPLLNQKKPVADKSAD